MATEAVDVRTVIVGTAAALATAANFDGSGGNVCVESLDVLTGSSSMLAGVFDLSTI